MNLCLKRDQNWVNLSPKKPTSSLLEGHQTKKKSGIIFANKMSGQKTRRGLVNSHGRPEQKWDKWSKQIDLRTAGGELWKPATNERKDRRKANRTDSLVNCLAFVGSYTHADMLASGLPWPSFSNYGTYRAQFNCRFFVQDRVRGQRQKLNKAKVNTVFQCSSKLLI